MQQKNRGDLNTAKKFWMKRETHRQTDRLAVKENKTTVTTIQHSFCVVLCEMLAFYANDDSYKYRWYFMIRIIVNKSPWWSMRAWLFIHFAFAVYFRCRRCRICQKKNSQTDHYHHHLHHSVCSERIQIWPYTVSPPFNYKLSINSCGNYSSFLFLFYSLWRRSSSSISHLFHSLNRALTQNNSKFLQCYFFVVLFFLLCFFFFESFFVSFFLLLYAICYKCWKVFWQSPRWDFLGPPQFNAVMSNYVLWTAIHIFIFWWCIRKRKKK